MNVLYKKIKIYEKLIYIFQIFVSRIKIIPPINNFYAFAMHVHMITYIKMHLIKAEKFKYHYSQVCRCSNSKYAYICMYATLKCNI